MGDSPSQTIVVQLPSNLARRISALVDYPNASYESISEFVKIAVENQLVLDAAGEATTSPSRNVSDLHLNSSAALIPESLAVAAEPQSTSTTVRGRARTDSASRRTPIGNQMTPSPSSDELLKLPQRQHLVKPPMSTTGFALEALTNRLSPLIAGPRVLANLTSVTESAPKTDVFTELCARAARDLGLRLRTEDDASGRRGRLRRSTAWPIGDDEAKSLIRYRNSFMLSADSKGVGGLLIEFGLVAVEENHVYLTEAGASMAIERIPVLDDADGIDLLTDQLRRLLAESLTHIDGEVKEIRLFLDAMTQVHGVQDGIDRCLSKAHDDWSDAQVVSHRAAMIGRLRDLAVVDVETSPKTKVLQGIGYGTFVGLLDSQSTTNLAERE